LRNLIQKAKKEKQPVKKEGILFTDNNTTRNINIEVVPVKSRDKNSYYLVLFRKSEIAPPLITRGPKSDPKIRRIITLENELKEIRDHIKGMSEEFEATREELQSANEEILSSNEELQSINEELETSKEELQSTNEELVTINEELQLRNNELKESVDYTRAIVETIHEPLLVLNNNMKIGTANKAFYQLFKTNPAETEGASIFGLENGNWGIAELKKQLNELPKKNSSKNFEISHRFKAAGEKILLFYAMRLEQHDTNKDKILLAIEDITQRKLSELELKQREENFRVLVQNSADIITIFSIDGTIRYQSESVQRILGYTPEETEGKNIFTDSLAHPDDKQIKETMFKESQTYPRKNIFAQFRLRHKNGSYRMIEAVCINQLNDPRVNGIVANFRDITEKQRLEGQKEEFIAIASHELKTPVTSIKAYAEILQEKFMEHNDHSSAELVKKMETQVDRLTDLISDLLDTTKIVEGQLPFSYTYFDMAELINEKTEELQRTTHKHKLVTQFEKGPRVWGDRERTGQVIVNLVSNAIKYSPNADKIIISAKYDNEENITVCVQDFGIGIDPKLKEKVFDRFFRVNDPEIKTFPGLGLGLYIAAEIIKRQSGKIWLTSEQGKGSSFYFSVPLKINGNK
jgi:two-component system CheB/CheR fusion protein